MKGRHFYDPFIQEAERRLQIRGLQIGIGGTYVLMDDMIGAVREYAQSLDPEHAEVVNELANWLTAGVQETQVTVPQAYVDPHKPPLAPIEQTPVDDLNALVDRVELFPTEHVEGRKKWHARSVDAEGNVLKVTEGSFDKTYVEQDARERWPGKMLYEVQVENERSKWKEEGKRGYDYRLWAGAAR